MPFPGANQVESLIVRLMGDGSSYQNMLQQASKSTKAATQSIKRQAQEIEKTHPAINKMGQNVRRFSAQAQTSLRRVQQSFQRLGSSIGNATTKATTFLNNWGGYAAVGGLVGIAALIRRNAAEIDNLAKTSTKLGIATEELAGLHVAAQRTGVDTRTLNMALQRMTRRVAEAARGTGEAKDAIAELGLDAQRLVKLSPDQVFREVTRAMQGVSTQSDKVRLAFKLFDSEGAALVNTMEGGVRALESYRKEAERLGLAVSGEQAKQIEAFNDEMDRLKAITGSLGRKITIDVAPTALGFLEGLTSLLAPQQFEGLQQREQRGFTAGVVAAADVMRASAVRTVRDIQYPFLRESRTMTGVAMREGERMSRQQARELLNLPTEQSAQQAKRVAEQFGVAASAAKNVVPAVEDFGSVLMRTAKGWQDVSQQTFEQMRRFSGTHKQAFMRVGGLIGQASNLLPGLATNIASSMATTVGGTVQPTPERDLRQIAMRASVRAGSVAAARRAEMFIARTRAGRDRQKEEEIPKRQLTVLEQIRELLDRENTNFAPANLES